MVADNIFYVPWPDVSEWNTVREQIFSTNVEDTISAYHTILMWKLKYDSVPAYVECTYSLLQVMVKEYEMTKNEPNALLFNENDLKLSYATALIRFVNHVSSISSYKGETLYLAAKTQNIPDWIINMRHDVAHGQHLPALDALHIAAELSLKWLLDNYWGNPESFEQKTVDVTAVNIDSGYLRDIDRDAQNLFKKFLDIWEIYHENKYKKNQSISELDREFILHLEELLSLNTVYFNSLENDAAVEIQNIVDSYSNVEVNGDHESDNTWKLKDLKALLLKLVKNILKSNDQLRNSLVMSLFDTSFLQEKNINPNKWREILSFLQETNSFSFFLELLFQMAGKGHKGASKWLSILPPSIKHLRKQWAVFKMYKKEQKNFKTKLLKKKVLSLYPPLESKLVVPLDIFKPPVISLDMINSVLMNPEQLSVESITEYLKLVKPPLMSSTIDMITDLVGLHVAAKKTDVEEENEERVFTVEDLNTALEAEMSSVVEEASDVNGWTKSSIDVNTWNKCPLGLLPFQTKVDCSLPENLNWVMKSSSRKRSSIPLLRHSVSMKKFKQI